MNSTNGTNGNENALTPSGPIVREIYTDSGVRVRVIPLSPHSLSKLNQKAIERYALKDEDKERFRKPVPNSAHENDTYIDTDDPEYVRLRTETDKNITEFKTRALRDISLTFPDGKEALIERFAEYIATQRQYLDLPDDPWEATFWHAIITTAADHETLIWAAENALPLTVEEVADGVRLFRYNVQGARPSDMVARVLRQAARSVREREKPKDDA